MHVNGPEALRYPHTHGLVLHRAVVASAEICGAGEDRSAAALVPRASKRGSWELLDYHGQTARSAFITEEIETCAQVTWRTLPLVA